jgi:hypothetical protein
MIFPTHVAGIPCQCEVLEYAPPKESGEFLDPPEPGVFDFVLRDRRGNHAKWLERKLSREVVDALIDQYKEKAVNF